MTLLNITQCAARAGVCTRTLERALRDTGGPSIIRIGRRRFLTEAELTGWIATRAARAA